MQPLHRKPTVAAPDLPIENPCAFPGRAGMGVAVQALGRIENLLRYDCRERSIHNRPLIFCDSLDPAGAYLFPGGLAIDRFAGVPLIIQYLANHSRSPVVFALVYTVPPPVYFLEPFSLQRGQYPFCIKLSGNFRSRQAAGKEVKHTPDHGGGILVHQKSVLIPRRFLIAKERIGGNTVAFFGKLLFGRSHFFRQVLAVKVVDHISEGHINQARRTVLVILAVVGIIDGDKSHVQERENLFQIVSNHDIVAAKPRHILDDDAVDLPLAYLFEKPPDGWPLHVRPRITVVTKFENLRPGKFRPQLNETADVGTLIDNAVAFVFFIGQVAVLGGEPDVNGDHIVQHLL